MNSLIKTCKSVGVAILVLLFVVSAKAQTLTAFFTNNIIVTNGDISAFFFPGTTNPLPGVCIANDSAPSLASAPLGASSIPGDGPGLGESPGSGGASLDGLLHPSGFNQRRIMSAYNPTTNGGTLFIGIDLPGGYDFPDPRSVANPSFRNDSYGPGLVNARGQVLPFDADGNGEADFIGRTNALDASRFSACPPGGLPTGARADIWQCVGDSDGALDDPRVGFLGEEEFYTATVVFGAGFVLGIIRTLWIVPSFGTRRAELMEAPIMLTITVLASHWVLLQPWRGRAGPGHFTDGVGGLFLTAAAPTAPVD